MPLPNLIERSCMQYANGEVAYGNGVISARGSRRGYLIKYLRSKQCGYHVLNRSFVRAARMQDQQQHGQGEDGEVNGQENAAA